MAAGNIGDGISAVLYAGVQYLQVPVMVLLIILVVITVFCLGAIVVEYFAERRYFRIKHRSVIEQLHNVDNGQMADVISHADLLKPQIDALLGLVEHMDLPDDELFAMAQIELSKLDARYERRVNLTDTIAKIGPMVGLMGTLIPLGPGIVAMGQGQVDVLSSSLLVAFDTTVAGLVAAAISLIISRVRRTWYGQYHIVMEALSGCVLEEAARAGEAAPLSGTCPVSDGGAR